MGDFYSARADGDFSRARIKEFLARFQTFLNPDRSRLLSLNDVRSIVKPKGETYRGMQVVSIEKIIGSEGRYRDFSKSFLPRAEHLRPRWVRVDVAHYKDVFLPPIQLYEIGGSYFVRDGNHRVSVAKLQGMEHIDAEVISLDAEIAIEPGMTLEELASSVIAYEKKEFYEQTSFGAITGDESLDFTAPGQYDVIINHILVHKYFINQGIPDEIPFKTALDSWYRNVYSPAIAVIKAGKLEDRFRGRTPSDLYVYIVKHWDYLKKKYGLHYPLDKAAKDFSEQYGLGLWDRVKLFFGIRT